ncbi:MAG: class I SAM-dependent methyltransferase [Candidatus Woesearchaeota archaeon]
MVEHYYTEKQKSALKIRQIRAILRGKEFIFYTGSGVFSLEKIDIGTKILIDESIIEPDAKILDLGCGYGPVGITLKKIFPKTKVYMTEINERAVMLAKKNAAINNVDVNIMQGNLYEPVIREKFDIILVNPPMAAGKKLCFQVIEQAKEHLNIGGTLQLVARHQKGGRELEKKMQETFGNVKEISKKSGFRIYLSRN